MFFLSIHFRACLNPVLAFEKSIVTVFWHDPNEILTFSLVRPKTSQANEVLQHEFFRCSKKRLPCDDSQGASRKASGSAQWS